MRAAALVIGEFTGCTRAAGAITDVVTGTIKRGHIRVDWTRTASTIIVLTVIAS